MVDSNKLDSLFKVIQHLVDSEDARLFWKDLIPTYLAFPKTVSSMKKLYDELKENPFGHNLSNKIRFIVELGEKAYEALDSKSKFKETMSTFKVLQSFSPKRDIITTRFYEVMASLKNLNRLSDEDQNILLDKTLNELIQLIEERKSVHFKPPEFVSEITHIAQQEQLLKSQLKFHASANKTFAYIFSNEPPSRAFQQGFKAGGFERALFEGSLGKVDGQKSMYILLQNQLNIKKAQQYKYIYAVEIFSPSVINLNNFPKNTMLNQSLVPRAIETSEIVGCFQLTTGKNPTIQNVERNKNYKKNLDPERPLLFRADSRHYTGDPSKNSASHVFQEGDTESKNQAPIQKKDDDLFKSGLRPWVNHSDSYKEYIDSRKPTIFVSTTDDIERTLKFPEEVKAKEKRYIYVMYKPERAIQSLSVYKNSQHALTDSEYLIPGGISGEQIIGMYTHEDGKYISFDFNPDTKMDIGNDYRAFLEKHNLPIPETLEQNEVPYSRFEA